MSERSLTPGQRKVRDTFVQQMVDVPDSSLPGAFALLGTMYAEMVQREHPGTSRGELYDGVIDLAEAVTAELVRLRTLAAQAAAMPCAGTA